jgi:hypothetical protein
MMPRKIVDESATLPYAIAYCAIKLNRAGNSGGCLV